MYQKSKIFNLSNFSNFSFKQKIENFEKLKISIFKFQFFSIFSIFKKVLVYQKSKIFKLSNFSIFPLRIGYFFPRSFLRFSYASRLRMSCCWWMRKEIRGGVQPGAVVRYPLRTTTWKTEEAEGIHRRRELVFTSPFVSSSWIICRTDLLVVSFL